MTAIKTWFLEKNDCKGFYQQKLEIVKETDKAVLIRCFIDSYKFEQWVPKSCIIDEWEKDTSNFGYHDYLVDTYHKAYEQQLIENYTIKSGMNRYRGDNFVHQMTTKQLTEALKKYNVQFMTRSEWNAR